MPETANKSQRHAQKDMAVRFYDCEFLTDSREAEDVLKTFQMWLSGSSVTDVTAIEKLKEVTKDLSESNDFTITLNGDYSVTYSLKDLKDFEIDKK